MENKGLIPKEEIDQVVQATDLVALISGYAALKPSGKNFLGLCPFHSEKTPSFVVSPDRGNYHCFGCGVHGNAVGFLMDIEHFHFTEAVEFLADRAGIRLTRSGGERPEKAGLDLRGCLTLAQEFYLKNLAQASPQSRIALYIKERALSPELCQRFLLGWAPEGWTPLSDHLTGKKVPLEIQEAAGLVKPGDKGGVYDRLRGRLIFPIRDVTGRCLGFAGRLIANDDPKSGAKYLNPPETELYKKSSVFYGVFEAKDRIRKTGRAMLVEGYLDVIRLHEKGFDHAIAACGTAVNLEHIKALKRLGVKELELVFDGDLAGRVAALKAARIFVENDLDSKVVMLPEGLDPDDFFKKYTAANFSELVEKAPYDYRFVLDRAAEEVAGKGISQKKVKLEELAELAAAITSKLKRDLFLGEIGKAFKVDPQGLRAKPGAELAAKSLEQKLLLPEQASLKGADARELRLMKYLVHQPRAIRTVRQEISEEYFENPYLGRLFSRFLSLENEEFEQLRPLDFPEFFKEYSSVLMQLIEGEPRYLKEYQEDLVLRWTKSLKKRVQRSELQSRRSDSSDSALDLVQKKMEERKRRKQRLNQS